MAHLKTSNQKGLVMLAVIFLVALLVPLIYVGTYFRLGNQRETFERSIQDRQLYWTLVATINQTKTQLENAVSQYRLDGTDINGNTIFAENTKVGILETPMNNWLTVFKNNFSAFQSNYPHAGSAAIQQVEFVAAPECARCFAFVNENDGLSATFTLEAQVRFSETNMTGAIRQMRQSLYVSTSNLTDFAIFYFNNFDTSPGTDTLYQGPIYVGKKANLTPNQGTTLTISFKEGDPGAYALKANQIYWFANRDLGCDPYDDLINCIRDPDTKEFLSGSYEKDEEGNPVFYYYNSNNFPGWIDGSDINTSIDATEKSTIKVKNNSNVNFDSTPDEEFTKLIGSDAGDHQAPTERQYFFRGAGPLKLRSSTYIDSEAIDPIKDGSIVNTTLALDLINPLSQFINPGWPDFLTDHFEKSNGEMLLEDNTPTITLQLGGATDPHEIIDPAEDDDSLSTKRIKLHWLARNYDSDKYYGLAIDFRYLFCNCALYDNNNTCSQAIGSCPVPDNDPKRMEDPLFWHSSAIDDGFIKFEGLQTDYANLSQMYNFIGSDAYSSYFFKDKRTDREAYQTITIDIEKLKNLIEHGSNAPEYAGTIFGQSGNLTREKPFLLFFSLAHGSGTDFYQKGYVIRLINAESLPKSGLTIATNGFAQTQGDFNTDPPEQNSIPADNDCEMRPAAVIADQVMALSNSWQDYIGDPDLAPAPSAPLSYIDPSDGKTYPTPMNGNLSYTIDNYLSHPIRCNSSNDPSCADVEVNAMIIAGNIPNQLMPVGDYEDRYGVTEVGVFSKDFNVNFMAHQNDSYGGFWQDASTRILSYRSDGGDAYIKENSFRYEIFGSSCAQTIEHNGNSVNVAFNTCVASLITNPAYTSPSATNRTAIQNCVTGTNGGGDFNGAPKPACSSSSIDYAQCVQDCGVSPYGIVDVCALTNPQAVQDCMTEGFRNLPVKTISYDPTTDVAQFTEVGTVADKFLDGNCTSCNGNIPLYLRLTEDYQIPISDIEDYHIKPYNPSDPNNINTLIRKSGVADSFIRPGTHFASITPFGRGWSNQLLPYHHFLTTSGGGGSCGCYADGSQCNSIQYSCDTNPQNCGTYCPSCPDQICAGGEGCSENPQCNQASCQNYCPNGCSGGYCQTTTKVSSYRVPDGQSPALLYGNGGIRRLLYSQSLTSTDYERSKRQFLYMPVYAPLYNGGFENLIRYGENWNEWECVCSGNSCSNCSQLTTKNEIDFSGTVHALWTAETLVNNNDSPAHWISTTYSAPERNFYYATTLKNDFCKPPGIPSGIIINVEGQDQQ